MTRIFENTRIRRILSMFLAVITVIGLIRWSPFTTSAADPDGRTADNASFNSWKSLFGADNLSTEFAGGVWTDKSVFTYDRYNEDTSLPFKDAGVKMTDTGDNFLVALSAIASNMQIEGYSNVPTDTMLVLDVSGSMNNESNRLADEMVEAANDAVAELLATNKYNRVGVVLYSGTSASSTNSDAAVVLLPLGRYTTGTDGEYISYSSGGWSSDERVSLDGDVRIEGTTNRPSSTGKDVVGATYIQKGVILAKDQFAAMSGDTTVTDSVLGTVTRTPVMVLMSDGAPTLATTAYTAPGQYQMGNGQASSTSSALGFVTQLSASYAKNQVEAIYDTDCLFYTLGIGISSLDYGSDVAESVLNPANSSTNIDRYWSNWASAAVGGRISVGSGRSVTKIDGLEQEYVDRYFAVENTSNMSADLLAAFADIVKTIQLQSVYHPTLVEGDNYHHDGYISFVDKIGEYMTVTDIKGLLIGGRLYSGATLAANFAEGGGGGLLGTYDNPTSLGDNMVRAVMERLGLDTAEEARTVIGLAYDHGQLSYTDENNFSNYIGWYANAQGEFLGFWYDGITTMPDPDSVTDPALKPAFIIRSYGFLGEADASHGVAESDMMYATIQVRESIESGETTVAFAVPASLIPLVTYNVTLGENDELTALSVSGAENPIRLVYEVALREDINSLTVHELVDDGYAYRNADGTYSFYTNKWQSSDVSYGTSNTYSYFEPSRANERYYYTEDSLIYADTAGTVFSGTLDAGGEYYRAFTVYRKDGGVLSSAPVYERISAASLAKAVANGDGTYYIPAGTVHTYIEGFQIEKADQTITETYKYENKPFVDAQYSYITGAVLGNNGRLVLEPETGIRLTKTINGGDADANAAAGFTFTVETVAAGTYDTVRVAADGTETESSVTALDGKLTVTLKDGEALYVLGLAPGSYTVTEADHSMYKAVTAGGTAGNAATVTVIDHDITDVDFVNAPKGSGKLLVTKEIDHDLGTDYDIPVNENTLFTIDVKLTGLNVANRVFAAKHSGDASITSVTTDDSGNFSVQLRHGDTFELSEITEGIVATVTERTPTSGFSAAYTDDTGVSLTDGIVTVEAGRNHYVLVTNTYDAEKVYPVNVTLRGDKIYDGEWNGEVFTVELQRYVSGAYTTIATADMDEDNKSFDFTSVLSAIDFDTPGTYYFKAVEKNAGQTIGGITYDVTEHTFGIVVTDSDMDGKLEISRVYSLHTGSDFAKNADGHFEIDVDFTNTYAAEGTSTVINIKKSLTDTSNGTLVTNAGFRFGLYIDEACTDPVLDADGNAIVSDLTGVAGNARILLTYGGEDVGETFTYYLKEIVPADANAKIDYSIKVYEVTVEVSDDGDGTSTAVVTVVDDEDNVAEFTNKYDPDDATLDLKVYKEISGRDLNANEFTFYVKDGDTVIATGKNDADGNVIFDKAITFDKVGTYSYTVEEQAGSLGGVNYDNRIFRIDITVSDIGGELKADMIVVNSTLTTITFKNTYKAEGTSLTLGGNKTLDGRTLINDEFEFILTETDEAWNKKADGITRSAFNFMDGAYAFAAVEYTEAGEYYYTVTEKNAGQVINGITYDDTVHQIKVVVTDDGEGKLHASVVDGEGNAIADPSYDFLNKYTAASTAATIPGTKVLEGKTLGPNDYSFLLWEADEDFTQVGTEPIDTAENGEGSVVNAFAFDEITFDKAGVYRYLVSEQYAGQTIKGVTYDYTVYRVEIHVIDNGRGQLEATTYVLDDEGAPVDEGIVFTNVYAIMGTGDLTLGGTKVLSGAENRGMEADEFKFELYATGADYVIADGAEPIDTAWNALGGSFAFDTITYGASDLGDHYYVIIEADTGLGGVGYDGASFRVKVIVSDNEEGGVDVVKEITPVDTDETDIVFNNAYTTTDAEATVEGEKTLSGKTIADGMFTFELWTSNENGDKLGTEPIDTAENVGESFKFDCDLSYSTVGKSYYLVVEQNGGQTIDGITYDGTEFKVVVDVTDNKAGALVADVKYYQGDTETALAFENSYAITGTGDLTLSGKKNLSGAENRGMEADEFKFELYATGADYVIADAAEPIDTAWNALGGAFEFDTITYDKDDLGDHYYVIVEADTGLGGVGYDGASFRVKVTVSDNEAGGVDVVKEITPVDTDETDIVFNNAYTTTDAEATIKGTKTLSGKTIADGMFTFELWESNEGGDKLGTEPIDTAENVGERFEFDKLSYSTVGKSYYLVVEQNGDQTIDGITYDGTVFKVVVDVTDNKAGALVADVKYYEGDTETALAFENSYAITGTGELTLSGKKNLSGAENRGMEADEFEFALYETGENYVVAEGATAFDTATNALGGSFTFDTITYGKDDLGDHYYVIRENDTNLGGVSYDGAEFRVKVTVSDNEEGGVDVIKVITPVDTDETDIVFNNTYTTTDAEATLGGGKKLKDKTLESEMFTFELWLADDDFSKVGLEPIDVKKNDGDSFEFDKLSYSTVGTRNYVIVEQNGGDTVDGITYDGTVFKVVVDVTDNKAGALVADVKYYEGDTETEILFENSYAITGTGELTLSGKKTLNDAYGRGMNEGEFEFALYETGEDYVVLENATPVDTKGNAIGGSFAFDTLIYDKDDIGKKYYVIREIDGGLGGIIYDKAEFRIEVTISDNTLGGVDVVHTVTPVRTIETDIAFTNTYAVTDAEATVEGTKTLSGKTIADGMFTFELWASNENGDKLGIEPIDTADNVGNGFAFDQLSYSAVDTYYYVVVEQNGGDTIDGITYDGAVFKVVVDVTDNKAGALVADVKYYEGDTETAVLFENSYAITGTGELILDGKKTLNDAYGRGMNEGEFKFALYETGADYVVADGATPIDEKGNALDGSFAFDTLTYDKDDIGKKYYVIREIDGGLGGIIYDEAEFRIEVTISDNTLGGVNVVHNVTPVRTIETDVAFTNTYTVSDATADIEGTKTLEGRDLLEGEFTFVLTPVDENGEAVEGAQSLTVTNAADGSFSFELDFDNVDVYYFTLTERKGDLERMSYDESVYFIKVTVTDNKSGALEATVETMIDGEVSEDGIVFKNVYTPKPEDKVVDITVNKTVKNIGKNIRGPEDFVFTLTDLANGDVLDMATDADGLAVFALTYTEDDIGKTCYYELSEMYGGRTIEGVTYSNLVYEIAVTISLSEDNELVTEVKINSEDSDDLTVPFENIYDSEWNYVPPVEDVTPPEQTDPETPSAPQTSDESRWGMWFGFLSLAAAGMIGTAFFGKKKKQSR